MYRRSKAWRFPALLAGAVAAALRAAGRQQGVNLGVRELPDVVRSLLQVHGCLCAKGCIAHSIPTTSRPMLGACAYLHPGDLPIVVQSLLDVQQWL